MERQRDLDARLARFVTTRDARDLWPDVSVVSFRAAQRELARVTCGVLTGSARGVPLRHTVALTARALGVAAFAGGMGPLIGYWCETGAVAADDEIAERFATALDHGRRRARRMRGTLDAVSARLAARGIGVCVLRSARTRLRYFPDPGTRTSADIDLLVRPDDQEAAGGALWDAGYVDAAGRWSRPDEPAVARSLDFAHADDPCSVHLHCTLDGPPAKGARPSLGTPDSSEWEVAADLGPSVHVLPQPLLLAYLATRTSSRFGAIMLIRLVELVLVMQRDFKRCPDAWRAFDGLVARTETSPLVFPALDLAERLAPGTVDPEVRERLAAATPVRLRGLVRRTVPATALRMHPLPPTA